MSSNDDLPLVAEAECLVEGDVPVRVRVHASPMYYGTGDFEDASDLAEDRPADTYVLTWDTADGPGGSENLASIDDVLDTVERRFPGARWLKSPERASRAA